MTTKVTPNPSQNQIEICEDDNSKIPLIQDASLQSNSSVFDVFLKIQNEDEVVVKTQEFYNQSIQDGMKPIGFQARKQAVTRTQTQILKEKKEKQVQETPDQKMLREETYQTFQTFELIKKELEARGENILKCAKGHQMQEITNEADMISICNYCQKPGQENRFGSFYCKECKAGLTDKQDHSFPKVCWSCLYQSFVPEDIPIDNKFDSLHLLPFSKQYFTYDNLHKYNIKLKKWVCASELLKGNPKIPQEWAKCDSGLTRELTNEEFDDKNMNTIDQFTNESDARICLKCLVKWKKFPEEDGKDYLVEDSQLQQPINTMKKEKQNLMLKSCVEFSDQKLIKVDSGVLAYEEIGHQLFSKLSEDFGKNLFEREKLQSFNLRMTGYVPQQKDFDQNTCIFGSKISNTSKLFSSESLAWDIHGLNHQFDSKIAMRVTNLLTFMCGTKIFIQELRILDPHNNFKIIKNIPLATRNFDDINKYTDQDDLENPLQEELLPSFLHFRNIIYYFKRFYKVGSTKDESTLQLYRYNFINGVENQVKNRKIDEGEKFSILKLNINHECSFIVISSDQNLNKCIFDSRIEAIREAQQSFDEHGHNSIVINCSKMYVERQIPSIGFVDEFLYDDAIDHGVYITEDFTKSTTFAENDGDTEPDKTEDHFLENQFFSFSNDGEEQKEIKFFSLKDFKKPVYLINPEDQENNIGALHRIDELSLNSELGVVRKAILIAPAQYSMHIVSYHIVTDENEKEDDAYQNTDRQIEIQDYFNFRRCELVTQTDNSNIYYYVMQRNNIQPIEIYKKPRQGLGGNAIQASGKIDVPNKNKFLSYYLSKQLYKDHYLSRLPSQIFPTEGGIAAFREFDFIDSHHYDTFSMSREEQNLVIFLRYEKQVPIAKRIDKISKQTGECLNNLIVKNDARPGELQISKKYQNMIITNNAVYSAVIQENGEIKTNQLSINDVSMLEDADGILRRIKIDYDMENPCKFVSHSKTIEKHVFALSEGQATFLILKDNWDYNQYLVSNDQEAYIFKMRTKPLQPYELEKKKVKDLKDKNQKELKEMGINTKVTLNFQRLPLTQEQTNILAFITTEKIDSIRYENNICFLCTKTMKLQTFLLGVSDIEKPPLFTRKSGPQDGVISYLFLTKREEYFYTLSEIEAYLDKPGSEKIFDKFIAKRQIQMYISAQLESSIKYRVRLGASYGQGKSLELKLNFIYDNPNKKNITYELPQMEYLFEASYMKCGYQKIYFDEQQNQNYIFMTEAISKGILQDEIPNLTFYESKSILMDACDKMADMVLFNMKSYFDLRNDPHSVSYFKRNEMLYCYQIADLYQRDARRMKEYFNLQRDMPNNYIFVTFLEDFHNYSHSGIKFLASDFYNRNLIMRAVLDNRQKTASIVAAFICDLDDSIPYDIEFMRALPFLMDKQPDNIKINEYFEQPDSLESSKFEALISSKAPEFSADSENQYLLNNVLYGNSLIEYPMDEFVSDYLTQAQKDERLLEKQKTGRARELQYDIKNTFIDFRDLIFSQKLNDMRLRQKQIEKGEKCDKIKMLKMNHFFLAKLFAGMKSNKKFFETQSVQKIVNLQYESTRIWILFNFFLYLFYYISFVVFMYQEIQKTTLQIVFIGINLLIIIYFIFIEFTQVRFQGIKIYLKTISYWNLIEWIHYSTFIAFFEYFVEHHEYGKEFPKPKPLVLIVLQWFIICFGALKILFYLRAHPSIGIYVKMVSSALYETMPFLIFFFFWLIVFTLMSLVLQVDYSGINDNIYMLPKGIQYFIQTFQNSIGNIAYPSYKKWYDTYNKAPHESIVARFIILFLVWFCFILNQIINLIILLNFLIAVVSAAYENVVADHLVDYYINKADFNLEYYIFIDIFNVCESFEVLIFQNDATTSEDGSDTFLGFVETLKRFITTQNNKLSNNISVQLDQTSRKMTKEIHEAINSQKTEIENIQSILKKLDTKIEKLSSK